MALPSEAEVAQPNTRALATVEFLAARRPIPKPEPPEECLAWLAFVRKQPCCNCGHPVSEAHHEGKKDAFAQKVRGTLAVPLCKICHSVYTQKNRLPLYAGVKVFRDDDLLSREDSLKILQGTQARLLTEVLEALDQQERIELLSKGLAKVRGLARVLECVEGAA